MIHHHGATLSKQQAADLLLCHSIQLHSDSSPSLASHASCGSSLNIWMRSFKVYGKWSVQASKQASIDTHTCAQYSHASVGLAQARPNYYNNQWTTKSPLRVQCLGLFQNGSASSHSTIGSTASTIRRLQYKICAEMSLLQCLFACSIKFTRLAPALGTADN